MNPVRPWTPIVATLGAVLLLAPTVSFSQSQLIVNRAGQQRATVTLQQDSNVAIDPVTGNVSVDCAPSLTNPTLCADPLGGSGGVLPPEFTLAASQFSQLQTAGVYPAFTQFRLEPIGLDATYEACRRQSTGPGNTNWNGVVLAGDATSNTVTVPEVSSSYTFSLRCFANGGARTSNVVTVATGAASGGNPNCPANWAGQPWANFTRSGERFFTDLRRLTGGFATPFPQIGGLVIFGAVVNQYVSVEFNVTSAAQFEGLSRELSWIESQGGGAGAASVNGVYFTISKCPGDFRLPTNTPDTTEPTLALGCRNITLFGSQRIITAGMSYGLNTPSSNTSCGLAVGNTYYLNFMTVNPLDGYQPNEHNCIDAVSRCGVQLQSQ